MPSDPHGEPRMTPDQLKARMMRNHLSENDLATKRGASARTVRRWKTGELDIPRDMEDWFDRYEEGRALS